MTTSHGQGDPRTKLSSRKPHAGRWPTARPAAETARPVDERIRPRRALARATEHKSATTSRWAADELSELPRLVRSRGADADARAGRVTRSAPNLNSAE